MDQSFSVCTVVKGLAAFQVGPQLVHQPGLSIYTKWLPAATDYTILGIRNCLRDPYDLCPRFRRSAPIRAVNYIQ